MFAPLFSSANLTFKIFLLLVLYPLQIVVLSNYLSQIVPNFNIVVYAKYVNNDTLINETGL